jgi:hypothetical protein
VAYSSAHIDGVESELVVRSPHSCQSNAQTIVFVEPLPEVARVVFISTPHRGSFVAGRQIIANLARRLTTLTSQLSQISLELARNPDATTSPFRPTAVDNMSPRHPFSRACQQIPVAPSISDLGTSRVFKIGPARHEPLRRTFLEHLP